MSALAPSEKTASPAASAERLSQKATLAQTKLATSVPSGTNQSGSRSEGADFLPSPKSSARRSSSWSSPTSIGRSSRSFGRRRRGWCCSSRSVSRCPRSSVRIPSLLLENRDFSRFWTGQTFSLVGGPSVGGLLVQLFSAPVALVADACSFLVSALCLRTINPVEPPTEEAERGHLSAGARFIARTSIMRASLLATATINFFNFVFFALFILYATRSLHVRPGTLGFVLGAGAVGGLIGSAVTGRLGRRIGVALRSSSAASCSR